MTPAPAQTETTMDTGETICTWADETFGPAPSAARVLARANEEMAEGLREATGDGDTAKIAEEAADVVIILHRVFKMCGTTMEAEVAKKMATNRSRTWKCDGTGHGYHVRDKSPSPTEAE